MNFTCTPILLILLSLHIHPNNTPPKEKKYPQSRIRQKKSHLAIETVVCHRMYPYAQIASLARAHCNELLVWLEASGFYYTINSEFSLGLLSDILLLPHVREILPCCFGSALAPSCTTEVHRWDGCWGGPTQWPGSGPERKLVSLPALLDQLSYFVQAREGANSLIIPCPCQRGQFYCAAQA